MFQVRRDPGDRPWPATTILLALELSQHPAPVLLGFVLGLAFEETFPRSC